VSAKQGNAGPSRSHFVFGLVVHGAGAVVGLLSGSREVRRTAGVPLRAGVGGACGVRGVAYLYICRSLVVPVFLVVFIK
jgi:hypothetical protein